MIKILASSQFDLWYEKLIVSVRSKSCGSLSKNRLRMKLRWIPRLRMTEKVEMLDYDTKRLCIYIIALSFNPKISETAYVNASPMAEPEPR